MENGNSVPRHAGESPADTASVERSGAGGGTEARYPQTGVFATNESARQDGGVAVTISFFPFTVHRLPFTVHSSLPFCNPGQRGADEIALGSAAAFFELQIERYSPLMHMDDAAT